MPEIPILSPVTRWECRKCNTKDVTREAQPHTRFHTCPGMKGITAPLVREGEDCDVRANIREDYVGDEDVTYDDDGRPVMAVETRYADGSNDLAVMAPCANMTTPVD